MGDDDRDTGTDLVQHLRLQWGVRCIFRHASFLATTGPEALDLCAAVLAALESPNWSPGIAVAARRWRTGVSSPAEAAPALRCLSESVAELAVEEYGEHPPPGLDPVLEQLIGEATSASSPRTGAGRVDLVTGCSNRAAFERDLADAVTDALVQLDDVAVALVELDPSRKVSDLNLLSLLAAIRRTVQRGDACYRVGPRKFAVLLRGEDASAAGSAMLRVTLSGAPRFSWGVSSLRSAGIVSADRADVVVLLAEADLHLRRRDYSHARHMLARQRRNSALTAVAGALVLVAGVVLGVGPAIHAPSHSEAAPPAAVEAPPAPAAPIPGPAAGSPAAVPSPSPAMSVPAHGTLVSYVTPTPPPSPTPPPTPGPGGTPPPSFLPPAPPPPAPVPQLLGSAESLLAGLLNTLGGQPPVIALSRAPSA
jgi:GGDEF domain-containing protein